MRMHEDAFASINRRERNVRPSPVVHQLLEHSCNVNIPYQGNSVPRSTIADVVNFLFSSRKHRAVMKMTFHSGRVAAGKLLLSLRLLITPYLPQEFKSHPSCPVTFLPHKQYGLTKLIICMSLDSGYREIRDTRIPTHLLSQAREQPDPACNVV